MGPGTWMKECGMKMPLGVLFTCVWVMKCLFAFHGMQKRYKTEDSVLRENFREEWEEYAHRVPHKFIPCVL
jgi:protein-S-isoprenylcysteine O-methyltransferase Ste14